MLNLIKDASYRCNDVPFGTIEVKYPPRDTWNIQAFQSLKEAELAAIRASAENYERSVVFGQDPYYRYFKKYKKSYPVAMQLESLLLKGRPFPDGQPVNEIAFLAELRTLTLLGTHDVAKMKGDVTLFRGTEKTDFIGMGERTVHIYPGDISGKDDAGIIFSMIAGADNRTCLTDESSHIVYLIFGTDGAPRERIEQVQNLLESYVHTLSPDAAMERKIY